MHRRSAVIRTWVLPAVPLSLLIAAPAGGGVEGSPHDLFAQGYDVVKVSKQLERCNRCHLPASPETEGVLPEVPAVLAAAYDAGSLTCFSCHDGTTIVSPNVDATRTAFHPLSHRKDLAGSEGAIDDRTGQPRPPRSDERRMGCAICHDPHDNGNRPFLRADVQQLCLSCHAQLAEFGRGTENATGNHVLDVDPAESPRADVPLKIADAFRTPLAASYPMARGKGAGSWHWDLGGRLSQGRGGRVGCPTCHAVHGDETAPPARRLLVAVPVGDAADLLCEGCHVGVRGDGKPAPPHPNPGGTTTARTYHPVDDDEANGAGRSLEVREPSGWPFGGGTPRRLLCTTCHTPHGAWVRTPLLRMPATSSGFCEACHDRTPEHHHPTGVVEGAKCGSYPPSPAYGTGVGIQCVNCHRAHNAGFGRERESDHIPLLINPVNSIESCTGCHPAGNPTCGTDPEHRGTHFMGDPTLEITYADAAPPLRTEAWPESGLLSMYGGENGKELTCLSCHSFKKGALVTGDDGASRNLLARSGNGWEWAEGGESGYLCTGCHGSRPGTDGGDRGGHTHPLMSANVVMLGRAVPPPLSATSSGKMNCESCHRPHEASTKAGSFILEVVEGANEDSRAIRPSIVFTVLCYGCHDEGKY